MSKKALFDKLGQKLVKLVRWSKMAAKFAAFGTALGGAVSAFTSSSATVGLTIGATGATSYAAAKTIIPRGYEITKHTPPRAVAPPLQRVLEPVGMKIKTATPARATGYKPPSPLALRKRA